MAPAWGQAARPGLRGQESWRRPGCGSGLTPTVPRSCPPRQPSQPWLTQPIRCQATTLQCCCSWASTSTFTWKNTGQTAWQGRQCQCPQEQPHTATVVACAPTLPAAGPLGPGGQGHSLPPWDTILPCHHRPEPGPIGGAGSSKEATMDYNAKGFWGLRRRATGPRSFWPVDVLPMWNPARRPHCSLATGFKAQNTRITARFSQFIINSLPQVHLYSGIQHCRRGRESWPSTHLGVPRPGKVRGATPAYQKVNGTSVAFQVPGDDLQASAATPPTQLEDKWPSSHLDLAGRPPWCLRRKQWLQRCGQHRSRVPDPARGLGMQLRGRLGPSTPPSTRGKCLDHKFQSVEYLHGRHEMSWDETQV